MSNPLAKHVPVVLTALLVHQVVHILQLLVLPEPMPVVLHHRVIHVVLGNTMVNKDKLPNLVANHVVLELTVLLVPQVVHILQLLVPLEPMPMGQHRVLPVVLENTIIKQVKRLNQWLVKVAMWENTKTKREKHPARMIV